MSKLSKKIFLGVFCLIVIFQSVIIFIPKDESQILSNNNYLKSNIFDKIDQGVDSQVKERLPIYDFIMSLRTDIDLFLGKQEINDVYICENRTLINKPNIPDNSSVSYTAQHINNFSKQLNKPTYSLILPTAAQINDGKLPDHAPRKDEVSVIKSFNYSLNSDITTLDANTPLFSVKDGTCYYNTDPMITSFGAFSVYSSNIKKMGFNAAKYKNFNIEFGGEPFLGSLYDRTYYKKAKPDKVELYHYNNEDLQANVISHIKDSKNEVFKTETRDTLYNLPELSKGNMKKVFIDTSEFFNNIHINNASTKKKLVIIGDKNSAPFIQFFALHYGEICVFNMDNMINTNSSYMDEYRKIVKESDDVLFLFGIESLADKDKFENLKHLKYNDNEKTTNNNSGDYED